MTDRCLHYIRTATGVVQACPDVLTWSHWFKTADRQIALTLIGDGPDLVRVSTVFLGLDHDFLGRRPVLWETLVFGGSLDGKMYRYESELQAQQGHEKLVALVKQTMTP